MLCVVSQQGCVRIDCWERSAGGRVPGPAKLTETVATSASACVTASVVSAVWLQVTMCMHVCLQLSLGTLLWALPLQVCVCACVCVSKRSCANIHLCVFSWKMKTLFVHRVWAQSVRAEPELCVLRCKSGHCECIVWLYGLISAI